MLPDRINTDEDGEGNSRGRNPSEKVNRGNGGNIHKEVAMYSSLDTRDKFEWIKLSQTPESIITVMMCTWFQDNTKYQ
jgi:hypothetical protein